MELRLTFEGDPPIGHVDTGERNISFVGWSGLLRAVAEVAGEPAEDGEPRRQ